MADAKVYVIESNVSVNVTENNVSVNVIENPVTVELGVTGLQGPRGEGVVLSEIFYLHNQSTASTTWTINHNLNFYPNITVVDSSGNVVEGSYSYPNETTIIASFSGGFSGKAYLS